MEIDRVIAEKAGVSVSAVTNYRKRHGIPSARSGGNVPAAAPAPAPAPVAAPAPTPVEAPAPVAVAEEPAPAPKKAASGAGFGYKVTIGDQEFVVVASDIAEAARRALDAGRGEVSRIEVLGRAIGG